jgi:hypothetical protein
MQEPVPRLWMGVELFSIIVDMLNKMRVDLLEGLQAHRTDDLITFDQRHSLSQPWLHLKAMTYVKLRRCLVLLRVSVFHRCSTNTWQTIGHLSYEPHLPISLLRSKSSSDDLRESSAAENHVCQLSIPSLKSHWRTAWLRQTRRCASVKGFAREWKVGAGAKI